MALTGIGNRVTIKICIAAGSVLFNSTREVLLYAVYFRKPGILMEWVGNPGSAGIRPDIFFIIHAALPFPVGSMKVPKKGIV
jgi:hypothetical protein